MFVKAWMTPDPQTVSSDTPMMDALDLLRAKGFRRLPIVDQDQLVGIVTDRDLKEAAPSKATSLSVHELNYLLAKLTVKSLMTRHLITVSPDTPVEEAAQLMEDHKVSGLPVLEDDQLVGIVTITDVLRAFVSVLGVRAGGTRITAEVPDDPELLANIVHLAAPHQLIAALTTHIDTGQSRELVFRLRDPDTEPFVEQLSAAGFTVTDLRS